MSTITGYKKDTVGSYIEKDPEARLIYSMDWSEWLPLGEIITSVDYTVSTIAGDQAAIVNHDEGITDNGTVTYVELSGGTSKEIYTVTAESTTDEGNIDRRAFRLKVINRFL
jgi:hypothetical protein